MGGWGYESNANDGVWDVVGSACGNLHAINQSEVPAILKEIEAEGRPGGYCDMERGRGRACRLGCLIHIVRAGLELPEAELERILSLIPGQLTEEGLERWDDRDRRVAALEEERRLALESLRHGKAGPAPAMGLFDRFAEVMGG